MRYFILEEFNSLSNYKEYRCWYRAPIDVIENNDSGLLEQLIDPILIE